MDFDDRFLLEDFREHIYGFEEDAVDIDRLITRTTKNTRGGNAFSYKPIRIFIGSSSHSEFFSGFKSDIDSKGPNPHKEEGDPAQVSSSFWIRFGDPEPNFQIKVFCSDKSLPTSLRFYQGVILFRDVIPGSLVLQAQRGDDWDMYQDKEKAKVLAQITLQSRRPAHTIANLVPPIPGRNAIFERQATETDYWADNFQTDYDEISGGIASPLGSNKAVLQAGLWLSYRFQLSITLRQYKLLWQCMIRLRMVRLRPKILRPVRHLPPTRALDSTSVLESRLSNYDFPARYLLEGLTTAGIIGIMEVNGLMEALEDYRRGLWPLLLRGLFTRNLSKKRRIDKVLKDVADGIIQPYPLPPHCVMVRRCLVTPLRCLLQPPQIETSNSFLRAHSKYSDRIIRVQFVEEDRDLRITAETLVIDKHTKGRRGTFARVRRIIEEGLVIAGMHFVFCCFGESQVKEKGCWMIAEYPPHFTVDSVLRWMGDLSKEKVVAKHAARQGLALSTTRLLNVPIIINLEILPDITAESHNKTYTFTDGQGQCSQAILDRCAAEFGDIQGPVCAAQVRLGNGCKGIIVVVPGLSENTIRVRPSMVKFDAEKKTFNIVKLAKYGPAYLNRQAIILLEALDVPREVLLGLFFAEKSRIEGIGEGQLAEIHDNYHGDILDGLTMFPLGQAIEGGFVQDPLWKARIRVKDGAYLMGVADETGTLKENEVYCQIFTPLFGRKIIEGDCTVFRNPCLHPGDLRRVKAVDYPNLSHYVNVVVFPIVGHRDLPNMMGGGDLDGDHYTILWDNCLLIPRTVDPMDYTGTAPVRVDRVTIQHTKKFFVDHILNNILGIVCNAHMALADESPDGPYDPACLVLAAKASQAVDFSKTGVPVERDFPRAESYPDYMGKVGAQTSIGYIKKPVSVRESKKVLGDMFRSIDPEPIFNSGDPDLTGLELPLNPTSSANLPRREYLTKAADMKYQYEFELNGLLNSYNIVEAECVAGVLLRSRKRRIKIERDYSLRVAVREAYAHLQSSFVDNAAAFLHNREDWEEWCLACYYLTYYPDLYTTGSRREEQDISFSDGLDKIGWGDDDEGEETPSDSPQLMRPVLYLYQLKYTEGIVHE